MKLSEKVRGQWRGVEDRALFDGIADDIAEIEADLANRVAQVHWKCKEIEGLRKERDSLREELAESKSLLTDARAEREEAQRLMQQKCTLYFDMTRERDSLMIERDRLQQQADCPYQHFDWKMCTKCGWVKKAVEDK